MTGARGTHDPDRVLATVMFTDIVRSTEHAARLGDRRWHDLISDHDQLVGRQIAVYRGRTIRSTGDGVFASFDGPGPCDSLRAVAGRRCADARRRHPCRAAHRRVRARRRRPGRGHRPHRARGSPTSPSRARCSCRARCATSWSGRTSGFSSAAPRRSGRPGRVAPVQGRRLRQTRPAVRTWPRASCRTRRVAGPGDGTTRAATVRSSMERWLVRLLRSDSPGRRMGRLQHWSRRPD